VLVSLASSTNILPAVFNKKELKAHKKRIAQIANGEITGKAAIAAAQTAAMVAAMMPAMVAGTMAAATH